MGQKKKKSKAKASSEPKVLDDKRLDHCLKLYETKKYKRGIRECKEILKSFPDHPDTLAVQGLIVGSQSAPLHAPGYTMDEAYALCKKAVRADVSGVRVWHLQGLLQQKDKKYDDALKSFQMARMNQIRKKEPNNVMLDRDLVSLMIQRRTHSKHVELRRQMLVNVSNKTENWMGFAYVYFFDRSERLIRRRGGGRRHSVLAQNEKKADRILRDYMVVDRRNLLRLDRHHPFARHFTTHI